VEKALALVSDSIAPTLRNFTVISEIYPDEPFCEIVDAVRDLLARSISYSTTDLTLKNMKIRARRAVHLLVRMRSGTDKFMPSKEQIRLLTLMDPVLCCILRQMSRKYFCDVLFPSDDITGTLFDIISDPTTAVAEFADQSVGPQLQIQLFSPLQ
jgi:hypothetical protein